jgi:ketosteroid isomerase-like protein
VTDRADVVRSFYLALRASDWERVRACFADDAELGFGGRNPMSGYHKGGDASVAVLRELVERSDGTFRPVLDDGWDVCASEHHVIVFDWFQAQRGNRQLKAYLYFVNAVEEGKIVRMFVHSSEQYEFDEFFAGGATASSPSTSA